MALIVKDRVKETSSTAGTGTLTLAGTSSGFQSFSVIGNGNTTYYAIVDNTTGDWEVGIGTYTSAGTTLSRDTILESSNGGAAVNFAANSKDVFVTYPAEETVIDFVSSAGTYSSNDWASLSPTTGTNVDLVLRPLGNGSIQAVVADGTVVGGGNRGQYAVDFQSSNQRSLSTQVASASYSVISGGYGNTASGINSFVGGGYGNSASNQYAVTCGGLTNTASNTSCAVVGGYLNSATGQYSVIGGGFNNTSSGNYSAVFGGSANTSSGSTSFVGGGVSNTASGSYASVVGGGYGTTRSINGQSSISACVGPIAFTNGVSQSGLLLLGVVTTTAASTVLRSNTSAAGTTNQVILPNNSAYYFKGSVIANVTGGGNTKAWSFEGAIKRGTTAASTAIVGTVVLNTIAQDAGAAAWTISVTADTTNGGLAVTVTGAASTTIRWVAKVETTEVTY